MVVTNRLWDSINGFRFQYVVLVFHDGFSAIFEDSVKVKRWIIIDDICYRKCTFYLLVVIFFPLANVVEVDVRFTAAPPWPFPFMAMLLLLNESLKNASKFPNGWNIGIEMYCWLPRVAGTVELKSVGRNFSVNTSKQHDPK